MFQLVFEEANLRVRVFRVLVGARCRGAPRQASVLVCVVLAGTREGLVSLRVLV